MYEYKEMAKYYDIFYSNKLYDKEVKFLIYLISSKKSILDVGCGTGIHIKLLEEKGYQVDGLDLNKEMLNIAKGRVSGTLYEGNLLDFKIDKKYDVIISMFAVFNHLKSYEEFEKGIINCLEHLKDKGMLIIDLHNGRTSGKKENKYGNCIRIMDWNYDEITSREYTKINYIIDDKSYHDTHEFLIYKIDKIKEILNKYNLNYRLYEKYSLSDANKMSKNIEIVINK